jgi:hypothetical protein
MSSFFEKQLIMPCAALAYNYDAKQTDLHNQFRALDKKTGRNLKNWQPIFVQLINIAVTNSFLLAQRARAPFKSMREFKKQLLTQPLQRSNRKRKRPHDPTEDEI